MLNRTLFPSTPLMTWQQNSRTFRGQARPHRSAPGVLLPKETANRVSSKLPGMVLSGPQPGEYITNKGNPETTISQNSQWATMVIIRTVGFLNRATYGSSEPCTKLGSSKHRNRTSIIPRSHGWLVTNKSRRDTIQESHSVHPLPTVRTFQCQMHATVHIVPVKSP